MKGINYMKSKLIKVLPACLLFIVYVSAKSPINHMTPYSFGIEYTSYWRGQIITEAEVPSHEQIWQVALNYAPVEYIHILCGFGADRFEVDRYKNLRFKGNYGFSFSVGIHANSPAFAAKVLRITAGLDFLYLNSEDDYDFKYLGPVLDPCIGLLVHAGSYIDIEVGAKGHFIVGTMKDLETNSSSVFSNNEIARGYFNLTVISPNGAFIEFICDASQRAQKDFEDGPYEAGIGFSVGAIFKTEKSKRRLTKEKSEYFPDYEDMKKKQEKMAKEIE